MLKKITTLVWVLFLFSATHLFGQSFAAPVNFYYYQGKQINLETVSNRLLIKFNPSVSASNQAKFLENFDSRIKDVKILPAPVVASLTLPDDFSKTDLENLALRLQKSPEILYVSPFYAFDGVFQTVTRDFLVQLKNPSDYSILNELANETQTTIVAQNEFVAGLYHLQAANNKDVLAVANQFHELGVFEYAEPDFVKFLKKQTADPFFSSQWSLQNLGTSTYPGATADADMDVVEAWAVTTGSSSIKVAILDEGVDLNHPDLVNNLLAGYDATGLGSNGGPSNDDAHGTACAGIVAAQANNNIGVAGVAYNSKIIPVRIAYGDASGNWVTSNTWIGNAITWAWQTAAADVLSNSWGGGSPSSTITNAFVAATTSGRSGLGSPVLIAAGNGNGTIGYPATIPEAIAVGAMSMCNQRKSTTSCDNETWWGSDYGTDLDVMSPGVKIYATDISGSAGYSSGDYISDFNGTSSATPNAAGVMALILSANTSLTQAQARVILESTCDKAGSYTYANVAGHPNGTWHQEMGYGRINANSAVTLASGGCFAPSNLAANNLTETSAILSWAASTGNYTLQYGATGFTLGTGTQVPNLTSTSYNLTGLTGGTGYEFYVQANCGGGSLSAWAGPFSFTTLYPGAVIIGSGTNVSSTTEASPINIYYRSLRYQTVYTAAELTAAGATAGNITHLGWFVTGAPIYALPNYTIKIKHTTATNAAAHDGTGLTQVFNATSYAPTAGGFDMLTFQTPFAWNGTSNVLIDICFDQVSPTYNSSGQVQNYAATSGARYIRNDDSPMCGSTTSTTIAYKPQVQLVFQGSSPVTCPPPSNLNATNLTGTSANLSWTAGGTETLWNVEYGATGFVQGAGTTVNATATTYNLTGLSPSATYDYYVRAACGGSNGNSAWAGPFTFSTPCGTLIAPFTQSFNTANNPNCWLNFNTSASTSANTLWEYGNPTSNPAGYGAATAPDHTGNNGYYAWVDGSSPYPFDGIILESPTIDLTALTSPMLRFYLFSNNVNDASLNTLKVSAWNGTTWNDIHVHQGNLGTNWVQIDVALTGLGNSTKLRFTVNKTSAVAYYNDLLIDDVSVINGTVCNPPNNLIATLINADTVSLSWVSTASNFEVEYGLTGFTQGTGTVINTTNTNVDITNLQVGSTYDFYVRTNCGSGNYSNWTFTLDFLFDYCSDGGPSSANDSNVDSVLFVGATQTLSHTGCPGVIGVEDLTHKSTDVYLGSTYAMIVRFSSCSGSYYTGVGEAWIDWNQNLVFEPSESVGTASFSNTQQPYFATFNVTVPSNAQLGTTQMRLMQWEGGALPLDPCGTFTWGSVMDFSVDVLAPETDCPTAWTNTSNTTLSGVTLTKTSGANNLWDAGASSQTALANNTDGYIQTTIVETNTDRMFGFSQSNASFSVNAFAYSFQFKLNGAFRIYENGVDLGGFGSYASGDVFEIRRTGTTVEYYRNGTLVYTSATPSTSLLFANASLRTLNATIYNARNSFGCNVVCNFQISLDSVAHSTCAVNDGYLSVATNKPSGVSYQWLDDPFEIEAMRSDLTPGIYTVIATHLSTGCTDTLEIMVNDSCKVCDVTWMELVNTNISGNKLNKTSAQNGWNAGALSASFLPDGQNGVAKMTILETNTERIFGLGGYNSNTSANPIAYGIWLTTDGKLRVKESNVSKGFFGTYQTGDILAIQRIGTTIQYLRNGVVFYTSTTPSTGHLWIDVSLRSPSATIYNAKRSWNCAPCTLMAFATHTSDPTCTGDDGEVTFTANKPNVTYEWADNLSITTPARTDLGFGMHKVIVTDPTTFCKTVAQAALYDGCFGLCGYTWTNINALAISGNTIVKIGMNFWNGGAISSATLPAGNDGLMRTTVLETNTDRMFGFAKASTAGGGISTVDYSIRLNATGTVSVVEAGSTVASLPFYLTGDVFSIHRVGTTVQYKRNGMTFYTSTVPSTTDLKTEINLKNTGATIYNLEKDFGCTSSNIRLVSDEMDVQTTKFTANDFKLYPNPTKGDAQIAFNLPTENDVQLEVFSATGQKIISQNLGVITQAIQPINLDNQPNGVYWVVIRSGATIVTQQLVLMK